MDKAYKNIKSYFERKNLGQKCNFPKFLDFNAKFPITFFVNKNKGGAVIQNNKVRLSIGSYISHNYNSIVNKEYKLYKDGKINKQYKNNNNIIDGSYLYFNLPPNIKNIKQVEIVPIHNKYKINYTYNYEPNIQNEKDGCISIDIGMVNLFTIFDPGKNPVIFKGNRIIAINENYNKIISYRQSKGKSYYNQIINRENKLNHIFNVITNELHKLYGDKKEIIIGYNEMIKQEINIGRNNRKLYQIPYCKLFKKIENKFEGTKITYTNESYTSKCDALNKEQIQKQKIYSGRRIYRGLYSSKVGKLINADVNGAINIMRKIKGDNIK